MTLEVGRPVNGLLASQCLQLLTSDIGLSYLTSVCNISGRVSIVGHGDMNQARTLLAETSGEDQS